VVSPSSDSVHYVPLQKSEKIDIPTWRCLDDHELVGPPENEGSSEEDTADEFYEVLHHKQNERLKALIRQTKKTEPTRQEGKKHQKKQKKTSKRNMEKKGDH